MANEGMAAAASALSILWAETILERSPEELENKLQPNQFNEAISKSTPYFSSLFAQIHVHLIT